MATQRNKTTRSMQKPAGGGRATGGYARARAGGSSKNNTPLIIGGVVGGAVLLIVIIAVVAGSGGGNKPAAESGKSKPEAKPVDVSELCAKGEAKCEEGYGIIQQCEGMMSGRELSSADKTTLREKLNKGIHLIQEGNSYLDEANQKSGGTAGHSDSKYGKALKAAKMKLGELQ